MIRFILACWDLSSLLGPLPVQIGCTEHMTNQSDRKYFAGGVHPHDENVFGMLVETFGTLNLVLVADSIEGLCTDKQEWPRSECTETPMLKRIYSEDNLEKPRGQFPYSPKLISFPCFLRHLIWVYPVCIGLSVPIFRFFKFLIHASFVCISGEKRLYKMSFSPEEVFHHDFMCY